MQEIIIDGVNVAGCEYYQYKTDEDVKMRHPQSGDCSIGLCVYLFNCTDLIDNMEKHCIDNHNCYFKRLKRLKADLKEALKQLEFSRTHKTVLETELQRLKANNEKLKECLHLLETNLTIIRHDFLTCMSECLAALEDESEFEE